MRSCPLTLAMAVFFSLAGPVLVSAAPTPSASDEAFERYLSGLGYQDLGQWPEALSAFTQAIALDPHYAAAYYARGFARAQAGDVAGAQADWTMAITLQPDMAKAYLNRGRTFLQQGVVDVAEADFTKAISLAPSAEAYLERGSARWKRHDQEGALADDTQAIRLNPYLGDAYGRRGKTLLALGRLDEAAADFTKQIELREGFAEAQLGLGQVRQRQGRLTEAAEHYTVALVLEPRTQTHMLRAGVFEQVEDATRAIADYTEVIALEADDPQSSAVIEARRHRAFLHGQAGRTEQAIRDCTAVLAQEPHDAVTRYNRGVYRFSLGDLAGAREDWEASLVSAEPSLVSRINPMLEHLRARLQQP